MENDAPICPVCNEDAYGAMLPMRLDGDYLVSTQPEDPNVRAVHTNCWEKIKVRGQTANALPVPATKKRPGDCAGCSEEATEADEIRWGACREGRWVPTTSIKRDAYWFHVACWRKARTNDHAKDERAHKQERAARDLLRAIGMASSAGKTSAERLSGALEEVNRLAALSLASTNDDLEGADEDDIRHAFADRVVSVLYQRMRDCPTQVDGLQSAVAIIRDLEGSR